MDISTKILLPLAMLAAAVMLLGTAWVGDDAFITLRVIDNVVNGWGLRFNVIERVQVFTHPLWLIVITPFYALTREPMITTMLVSVLLSLAALWILATRIAANVEYGSLLVLAAILSPAICHFSTSGLETPLTFFLLALFVWQLYRSENIWVPAAIAGLLFLNRLDMVVLLGPVVVYLLFQARGGDRVRVAFAALFPALAWIIFSVIYYGAPFPNTAYAKLGTGFGTGELISRGLEYTKDFVLTDPLLALLIGKAVFDAARIQHRPTKLLGIGITLYVVYTITIGGDFMSGRFFAPPGFLAICLLARAPAPKWLAKHVKITGVLAIGVLGVLLVVRMEEQPLFINMIPQNGIADERRFYYFETGLVPVVSRWLTDGFEPVPQFGRRGLELKSLWQQDGAPVVVSAQAIGLRGYYGGSNVHVVDEVALADAFLARLPALPNSRVGHYQRMLPSGYAETVTSAHPQTSVAALQPLLYDVTLVTRAPLLAEGRGDAIWRLLSGQYHWIYTADIAGVSK